MSTNSGEVHIAIIENKLNAKFTWNKDERHQLDRYYEYLLKKCGNYDDKCIIVLCPQNRYSEIEGEIKEYGSKKMNYFKIKIWEDLCCNIRNNSNDEISIELYKFIEKRYLLELKYSSEEKKMIMDRDFSNTYLKTTSIIYKVYEKIPSSMRLKKPHFDNEDSSYGFGLKYKSNEYWFGFWPDFGAMYGNPIVLQNCSLKEANEYFIKYKQDDNNEFDGMVHIVNENDNADDIAKEILNIIKLT